MAKRKIEDIEGIGLAYAEKLGAAGIEDTERLLELCCDAAGRKRVAAASGIDAGRLLKWANMADLCRVEGIGPEFAELLEAAGVDTVKELRTRNPDNLAERMAAVNEEKKLTRRVPSAMVVSRWIHGAKALPALVTH